MQEKFIPGNQAKVTVKKVTIKKRVDVEFKRFKRNIEDSLIKMNFLPGLASALNNSRATKDLKEGREAAKFDLVHHLRFQDVSGNTEGCGCIFCKIHHQYVRYRKLYFKVRLAYTKRLGLANKPHKAEEHNIMFTSTHQPVLEAYRKEMINYQEKCKKYKTLRKELERTLKIPKV